MFCMRGAFVAEPEGRSEKCVPLNVIIRAVSMLHLRPALN